MIYVYAYEVVADGLEQQGCHYRAVYTSREGEQHLLVAYLTAYELYLVGHEVLHVPVGLGLTGVKHEILHCSLDGLLVASKLGQLHAAQCLVVACGHYGESCFVDFGEHVDFHTVDHMVGAAIDDYALHAGQCLQLSSGDVVRINLTVHAQCAYSSGYHSILVTTEVQDNNHVLFHKNDIIIKRCDLLLLSGCKDTKNLFC